MKRFFLRAVAYIGLYSEILSASCRWLSKPNCWGERKPWRTVVTQSLVATEYLPPTRAQVEAEQEHEYLSWIAAQSETIQTCLSAYNPELLKNFYKRPPMWAKSEFYPEGLTSVPAIPSFCKESELWVNINK